jgi:hypothetical protein
MPSKTASKAGHRPMPTTELHAKIALDEVISAGEVDEVAFL